MVEERVYVERGPSGLGVFFGLLVIVACVVVGVLWGTGALTVRQGPQDRVEVTYDPSKAEHAGDELLDKTGKALKNAGEKVERQAHKENRERPVR